MADPTLPGDLTSLVAGPLLRRGCLLSSGEVCTDDPSPDKAGKMLIYVVTDADVRLARTCDVALDLTDPAGMDRATRWYAEHTGGSLVALRAECWSAEHMRGLCLAAVGRTS